MNENKIEIFNSAEFGDIRTLEITDGKVLFRGKDVAKALGYSNARDALARHCKDDGVVKHDIIDSIGRTQQAIFITEGNVYRLITHSKLPNAECFESWVFDEVLSTFRKYRGYMTENVLEKALSSPDFLIQLATQLKEEQAKRKSLGTQAEQNKSKVTLTAMNPIYFSYEYELKPIIYRKLDNLQDNYSLLIYYRKFKIFDDKGNSHISTEDEEITIRKAQLKALRIFNAEGISTIISRNQTKKYYSKVCELLRTKYNLNISRYHKEIVLYLDADRIETLFQNEYNKFLKKTGGDNGA